MYSGYKSFVGQVACTYSLLVCSLSFHPLNWIFLGASKVSSDEVHSVYFSGDGS